MFLSSMVNDSHSKDGVVFHSTKALCRELIDRLNWPSQLFASEHDRCFCRDCYPLAMPNVRQATLEHACPVIVPRNWIKFGLKVDDVHASVHQVWVKRDGRERKIGAHLVTRQDKWAVSYHGTGPSAALSMVKHRQICLPGDRLLDGTRLSIRLGHIPQ